MGRMAVINSGGPFLGLDWNYNRALIIRECAALHNSVSIVHREMYLNSMEILQAGVTLAGYVPF